MPLSDDRLMEIAQSPRQAGVEDVEDLCAEIHRLREMLAKPFDVSDFELIKKYPSLAHPNWAKMLCDEIDRLREIERKCKILTAQILQPTPCF